MNINEQLEDFLANLGVEMEHNPQERNEFNDDDIALALPPTTAASLSKKVARPPCSTCSTPWPR